ncbi:hypothetical protein JCGZ_24323 [Jatropha curcas]|uniref:Integrase catalytic domain-containing protein n=1 Tax=Jatropha curcas TaxID=180498 RepID=A0A067LEN4_JATCU|nr:hypothetical protein JCGZ_24323 [Jatropha curcas]
MADSYITDILTAMKGTNPPRHYSLVHGQLFFKGRLVLPAASRWVPKLISEFHSTPTGGHSGAYRTYRRIASNFYWKGMMRTVQKQVAECLTCQQQKYEAQSPAGLLQPLPIPSLIWADISLDFITGLPKSNGFDCLMVVVDRLSKYAHFIPLRHPFTAKKVAAIFANEIIRLHGLPHSIISD